MSHTRYNEALSAVDDSRGRVMEQLRTMGIADQRLLIYMGDNGFMFGGHRLIDKRVAYETSIRVPMLMHCPQLFSSGAVVGQVVANIDIAPTILGAIGLQKPPHVDGARFLPLGMGQEAPWREYFLYVYYWEKNVPHTPTQFALRGDRFKYITYYGLWDADELYDLRADPGETRNLLYYPDFAQTVKDMESKLYDMMTEFGGMEIPINAPRGRSQNKRLRSGGGKTAGNFPEPMVLDEPVHRNAQ